jgi:hypothetical protein
MAYIVVYIRVYSRMRTLDCDAGSLRVLGTVRLCQYEDTYIAVYSSLRTLACDADSRRIGGTVGLCQ